MSADLDRLWGLHRLDEKAATVTTALARFPELRRSLEARVVTERARLEDWKKRVGDVQKARRQMEKDVEVAIEQERKFQSQLPAVKKNEEYTALLHQIAGCKDKRSEIETGVLMNMEQESAIDTERPAIEQALKSAEQEKAERLSKIDGEEQIERDKLAAIEAERALLLQGLEPVTRSRYDRIRASREGSAVVPILKNSCGGCYRAQPPQIIQEAKRRDRLVSCEGCGRLLVWAPELV